VRWTLVIRCILLLLLLSVSQSVNPHWPPDIVLYTDRAEASSTVSIAASSLKCIPRSTAAVKKSSNMHNTTKGVELTSERQLHVGKYSIYHQRRSARTTAISNLARVAKVVPTGQPGGANAEGAVRPHSGLIAAIQPTTPHRRSTASSCPSFFFFFLFFFFFFSLLFLCFFPSSETRLRLAHSIRGCFSGNWSRCTRSLYT
jgi:hypothetical protein